MENYISQLKKIEETYSNDIINAIESVPEFREIAKTISEIIKDQKIFPNYSKDFYENIKSLLLISPEEMIKHKNKLQIKDISANYKSTLNEYKKFYEKLFRDREYGDNIKYKWPIKISQSLSLNVCPYCNRNYINPRGNKQGGQTDHFFSRNNYPILSISLYNLIPACATCNLLKSNKFITEHPLLIKNNHLNFEFTLKENKKWSISNITNSQKDNSIIKELNIKEAYDINELDINKMYEIELSYSKPYRDKLKKFFQENGNISISDKYIDRILFGHIVDNKEEEFRNIPLSYLKYDFYNFLKKKRK
jgi:hypothetical protein